MIDTERLTLRPSIAEDRDTVVAMMTDPVVGRHIGGSLTSDKVATEFDAEIAHARPVGMFNSYRLGIADRESNVRLGTIHLEPRPASRPGHLLTAGGELELSYVLLRESAWGKGYAEEASRGLLGYLSARSLDRPILAVVQTSNGRSLRTARRLGFRPLHVFVELGAEQQLLVAQLATFATATSSSLCVNGRGPRLR